MQQGIWNKVRVLTLEPGCYVAVSRIFFLPVCITCLLLFDKCSRGLPLPFHHFRTLVSKWCQFSLDSNPYFFSLFSSFTAEGDDQLHWAYQKRQPWLKQWNISSSSFNCRGRWSIVFQMSSNVHLRYMLAIVQQITLSNMLKDTWEMCSVEVELLGVKKIPKQF